MRLTIALIALIATPAFADPDPQTPVAPDAEGYFPKKVLNPALYPPAPSLATTDSTALLALALAGTQVDLTARHSVGGALTVNPDGELAGAATYNHTFNLNWAAGLSLASDGRDLAGTVHLTYSWD